MRILIYPTRIFIAFLLLQIPHFLTGQIFEKLNGPYGGGAKVYEGKNGILFQRIPSHDFKALLYRSLNGGTHWTKMNNVPADDNSEPLSVGLDGNLFCFANDRLYKSTSDGQSWSVINSPLFASIQTILSLPDGTILIASSANVYQSTDNGQNWQPTSLTDVNYFFYNEARDETFAITPTSLFVSKDRGLSWNLFYTADFGRKTQNMQFAGNGINLVSGENYIWKLDSLGNLINILDPLLANGYTVDMALASSGRLFVHKYYKSFYSDNLGNTWIELGAANTKKKALHSFSSISNGVVFGVKEGSGGLYRSVNNGKNWFFAANGINQANIIDIDFYSATRFLAMTNDGLFYTGDGGQSWTFLKESYYEFVFPIEASPLILHGEEIYYSSGDTIFYFKDWKSTPSMIGQRSQPNNHIKLFINNTNGVLFHSDLNQLFRSVDKGLNWTRISLNGVVDLVNSQDGSILALTPEAVYRSEDDGDHWTQVFKDPLRLLTGVNKFLSNSFSGHYLPYQTQTLMIGSTQDNGLSWSFSNPEKFNLNDLTPHQGQALNNLDHIFLNGYSGAIYRSVDYGKTFNVFSNELDDPEGLAISPDQKLYVFSRGDGLYRTKISTSSARVLRGHVYEDRNKDCNHDNGENGQPNYLIVADNGIQKQYAYSNPLGNFALPIVSGNYNVIIDLDNNYRTSCDQSVDASAYKFSDTLLLGLKINSYCPIMKVDLQSTILRRCFDATIFVDYSNSGTSIAKDAYVDVTLDSFLDYINSSIPFSSQTGNLYRFDLGDVDPNTSGNFSIQVKVSCNATLGEDHCVEAHIYPDTACVQSSIAHIVTSAECLGDSVRLIIKNIGSADMSATQNWYAIDESVSHTKIVTFASGPFFLTAGQEYSLTVASRPRILFEAEQDLSYPFNKISRTQIISCASSPQAGAASFRITQLDEEEPYLAKFCERNRGSFDPNDITGYPVGITDKKFIDKHQQLDYVIRFQNTGTDTAFNVRIENAIPLAELDLTTLDLGASSHPYQFLLDPKGKLILTFGNILLPDSNINEKASHGFIQYSIKPVKQLSSGTKILNDAVIFFDYNDGVKTNREFHTIGSPVTVRLVELEEMKENMFEIAPNPMMQSANITLHPLLKELLYRLTLVDIHQREIRDVSFRGNSYLIDRKDLPSGVYYLVLKNEQGMTLSVRKLIIQ